MIFDIIDLHFSSPRPTCEDDVYAILAGNGNVSFPRTGFISLDVSSPAIPVLSDNGFVLVAAARYSCSGPGGRRDCGKVVVSGKHTILFKTGFSALVTNIINYLLPAGDLRNICILPGLNQKVLRRLTELYNGTCWNVVPVAEILEEVKDCAVIVANAAGNYTDEEDKAILDAVCEGAGLLVVGKNGANNDLTGEAGITFNKGKENRVKSKGVDVNLVPIRPQQCLTSDLVFGEDPCRITSVSDLAFVPSEGVGVGYYGAGRVAIIGSQPILTDPDLFQRNRLYIQDLLSFASQSKQNCSCTLGCFSRCGTFETFSANYATAFGVALPVKEITEACGTCCVVLNLRDVDGVDADALYAYVRGGGCLILTCRNRKTYDINAINVFLGPFGFEIGPVE